jgi:hypothetical protein
MTEQNMLMNIRKLHEPYKDEHSPSVEAQIAWLLRQNFPPNIVDQTMLTVYDEIIRGKTFINGYELDQNLLKRAREFHNEELNDHIRKLEEFYQKMKMKWKKEKKPWYRRLF